MSLKTQMVAKMMKWRPWPPLISKKLEVRQVVRRLENLCGGDDSLSCGATVKKDISNYDRMRAIASAAVVNLHLFKWSSSLLVVVLAVIRRSRILLLRQETAHSSRRRHNCRHRVPFDDDGATVDVFRRRNRDG
nr:uncharacterized protein LOC109182027 isoform X2 [Ipomoea batatas]